MRKFYAVVVVVAVVAVSAVASATALASPQSVQQVGTQQIQRTPLPAVASDDQLRQTRKKLLELAATNRALDVQLVQAHRDTAMSKAKAVELVEMERTIEKNFDVIQALTSKLMFECVRRRVEGGINGTLGLQLRDSATSIIDLDNQALTFVFQRAPVIDSVVPGSPAEKAGVHVGDSWIKFNGRPLMDSVRFDELMKPGSSVTMMVRRSGKDVELKPMTVARREGAYPADLCDASDIPSLMSMSPRVGVMRMAPAMRSPMPPGFPSGFSASGGPTMQVFVMASPSSGSLYAGARLQPLDDEWRNFSGLQGDGMIVTDVIAGSPAENFGLKKLDVIKQVNGEAVASLADFTRLLADQRSVTFTVIHKDVNGTIGSRTITVSKR